MSSAKKSMLTDTYQFFTDFEKHAFPLVFSIFLTVFFISIRNTLINNYIVFLSKMFIKQCK